MESDPSKGARLTEERYQQSLARERDARLQADALGLGLAIARHLTELHGGSIRAESAGIGKGATFTVSLPISSPLLADSESGIERST